MGFLDLETNFEDAAKIFLADRYGSIRFEPIRFLRSGYVYVSSSFYTSGDGRSARSPYGVNGSVLEYTQYELSLSISIISDASIDGTQTNHRSYREKVREAMLLNADNWTTVDSNLDPILPFYEVKYMRPSGTSFDVDGDLAISTLTYEIKFDIKPTAFP
jgi:hypothetical protein